MASTDDGSIEFEQQMNMLSKLFLRFNRNAAVKTARISEEHFKENFEKQGFDDAGLTPWEPRNPDLDPGRAILVDTSNLKNSIEGIVVSPGKIVIKSDLVYAKAHNEGVPARNLPQRQFIGKSKSLNDKIKKMLVDEFKATVKNKLK